MELRTLFRVSTAAIAIAATPVQAQNTGADTQSESASASGNEIIVTAQRREQRLQDVPVAISAFSSDDVDRFQMDDVFDVAKFVPSTHITQSAFKSSATYFIRGIGTLDMTSTNDPPITLYENDLIIPRPNASNIGLFDVERVEVLRGPQGTLFGRNTSGGAVNIILKKPTADFGGFAEGSYGSYDKVRFRGSINIPLGDSVRTKTSGYYLDDPGFIKNVTTGETVGGEKNWGIREDVQLLLNDDVTLDLFGSFTRNEGLGMAIDQIGTPAPDRFSPPAPNYYKTISGVPVSNCGPNPLRTWAEGGGGNCSVAKQFGAGSTLTYESDAGTLQLLYGFREYRARYSLAIPMSANPLYGGSNLFSDGYGYSHSTELKWSGEAFDGAVSYVAGLYYLNVVDENRLSSATANGTNLLFTQDIKVHTNTNSVAGYAQADIKIVDPLTLTVGGRFTHDVKKLGYIPQPEFGAPTISTEQVLVQGQPTKLTSNRFTPRVALQYKFSKDVSVFASATNGFKAGGWNARVNNPQLVVAVDPERVWAYEVGLRSQFFDGKATFNLTAFWQDLKGYQNTVQVFLPDTVGLTTLLQNIADVRTRGVEFDANVEVAKGLTLTAAGSFLDAKYTRIYEFPGVPPAAQLGPDEIPTQAPKFQITAGPIYTVSVGPGDLTLNAIWRHSSPYQISILNPIQTKTEDFVDASVRYETDSWYASVACSNCFDSKRYMLILRNYVYPVDPLRVTGTIGFKF